jgi:hypothetical protein
MGMVIAKLPAGAMAAMSMMIWVVLMLSRCGAARRPG